MTAGPPSLGTHLPRRAAIAGALGLGLNTGLAQTARAAGSANAAAPDPTRPGLAALAEQSGMQLGAMITLDHLRDTPALYDLMRRDATLLIPGFEFSWIRFNPEPGRYNFADAEATIDIADREHKQVRGHCLVWHEALPIGFSLPKDPAAARLVMERYIGIICRKFAGRVRSWVVVNEAVFLEDQQPNGLRDSPFYRAIGPDYIRLALEAAHAADPAARLIVNDFDFEQAGNSQNLRRAAMLKLLEKLVRQGAPVHGLGIQGHMDPVESPIDQNQLQRFIRAVGDLGLEVHVTEMDVIDRRLPANIAARDRAVARYMTDFLDVVMFEKPVLSVSNWGLEDRHSWMNESQFTRRKDGLPTRGHMYDRDFKPKPAWYAMEAVLRARLAAMPLVAK